VFDIGVAYREDVDEVIEVIKQVDEELRNDPEFKDDIMTKNCVTIPNSRMTSSRRLKSSD